LKPLQVFRQAENFAPECAKLLRDGRSENKASIKNRDGRLRCGNHLAAEICQWFCHVYLLLNSESKSRSSKSPSKGRVFRSHFWFADRKALPIFSNSTTDAPARKAAESAR